MEHSTSFGDWLTTYRQGLHLQRSELAARIGCAVVTLRKIEMDERRPSREMAEQLAEQLAISPGLRPTFVRVARGELSVAHLPSPRPSSPAQTSLPHLTTSLTGRNREIEEIRNLLIRPDLRLLTLTGAPGVGKTRLALGAAEALQDNFPDGVFYVSLAPLTDPHLVLLAIAHSLQMGATGRQSLVERLGRHLRTRQVLLVLDNFEHLLASAPQLTQLLEATSQLKLLVTSQSALELSGEYRLIVLPLAVPSPLENRHITMTASELQERYSAVDLFVKRAQAVKPGIVLNDAALAAIGEICRKLDGLPLAIEFVAARAVYFTPQELLTQLVNHFPLKASGSRDLPARHLSLEHALDWSYSLLLPEDRQLFRRLSVFVGGCTLEAITAVYEKSPGNTGNVFVGITTLLNNSLLQRHDGNDGNSRFEMLQTVREYALNQLTASGEAETIRLSHALYFLGLAEAAEKAWDGPDEWKWLRRLIEERDNLRAALHWTFETKNVVLALKYSAALFSYWTTCSSLGESRHWLEATLALPVTENKRETVALEAKILNALGYVTAEMNDTASSYGYFERGLALYRRLEDKWGIAWSIRGCAYVEMQRNQYKEAGKLLEESLKICEGSRDEWGWAWSLYALAFLKLAQGNLAEAQISLEKALVFLRSQKMLFGIFRTLIALAYTVFEQGDIKRAEALFREALLLNRETPLLTIISAGLEGLAVVAARQGKPMQAARLWGATETMRGLTGQRRLHVFQRSNENALKEARSQVTPTDWEAAWAEGRNLSTTQALSEGLNILDAYKPSGGRGLISDSILPI